MAGRGGRPGGEPRSPGAKRRARRFASLGMLGMTIVTGGCYLPVPAPPPPWPLRSPHPVDWPTLVGCWRMTSAASGRELVAFDSMLAAEPRPAAGGPLRRARSIPPAYQSGRATWRVTERNTVEYVDHAGWGSTWEFVVRGDSLAGRMYAHTHVMEYQPRRLRAAAVRVPCP
jgi:hypothetical protein